MDGRIRCPPILAVSKNGHASPYPLFAGHRPVESITGAIGSESWRVNWIPPITIICFQRYRKSSTVSTFGRMRATGRRTESFLELSCARKRRSQRICPFGKRLGRHWAVDGFRSLMRLDPRAMQSGAAFATPAAATNNSGARNRLCGHCDTLGERYVAFDSLDRPITVFPGMPTRFPQHWPFILSVWVIMLLH